LMAEEARTTDKIGTKGYFWVGRDRRFEGEVKAAIFRNLPTKSQLW
jgi:hypothetical protein